jgi:hypothetical protein
MLNGSDFALPASLDSDVLVIDELSANHGGSMQRAVETVRAAADAGAGALKLQTYTPDTMTRECGRDEFVLKGGPDSHVSVEPDELEEPISSIPPSGHGYRAWRPLIAGRRRLNRSFATQP